MEDYSSLKLDNQVCFRLYAASREIIKKYKPLLDEYNLTYTQYLTMLVLWEEEKATVKYIGTRLRLDSGTLTPLLKKLEAMEVVRKYRDPKDDRSVIVEITEKGLKLKDEVKDVPKRALCSVGVPREELLELKVMLDGILNKI
ncbi:MarR family transcriptional regulator [uncultured Clostridium sp.]|jgi:DNA-binding MarR family transcriptional regulator|uniref:MarR family winged helix-turn-helix transcriptional regulator n=1 Tax=uncultured Clostridium sp. TaxID=59620 RepID=UPI002623D981|nr:MarR family transcriptional regulator [uncultured Clostridium sp.]